MKHYCRTDTLTVMDITAAKITPTSQRLVEFRIVGQKGIDINASYPMFVIFGRFYRFYLCKDFFCIVQTRIDGTFVTMDGQKNQY